MKRSFTKRWISALLTFVMLMTYGSIVLAEDVDETDDIPFDIEEPETTEETLAEASPVIEEVIPIEEEELSVEEAQPEESVDVEISDEEAVLAGSTGRVSETVDGRIVYRYYENGSVKKNCWIKNDDSTYYYADSNGELYTGCFATISGKKYCFDWNSTMRTGRFGFSDVNNSFSYYYATSSGELKTGWIKITENSHTYYYYADSNYHLMYNEWKKIGGKWYFFDYSSYMLTGNQIFLDPDTGEYEHYLFDDNGAMLSGGWVKYQNNWYYLTSSGKVTTNWKQIKGKWYYFGSSGTMCTGETYVYDGNNSPTVYYFDDNGVMQTGWIKLGTSTSTYYYYATSSGALVKGWKKINNKWYYFDDTYRMSDGLCKIDGEYYYFKDGAMKTGWIQSGSVWYYANSSGVLSRNEWLKSGGKWYYFNDICCMVTGYKYIDGNRYRFNSDGVCLNP